MDITTQSIAELSAMATVIGVVLFAVWRGIPALISYLKCKDEKHQEQIMKILADAREERELFYKGIASKLDRIHDRLDKFESSVNKAQP